MAKAGGGFKCRWCLRAREGLQPAQVLQPVAGEFSHRSLSASARRDRPRDLGLPSLPRSLRAAGHRTGILGKLHIDPESAFPFDFPEIAWRELRPEEPRRLLLRQRALRDSAANKAEAMNHKPETKRCWTKRRASAGTMQLVWPTMQKKPRMNTKGHAAEGLEARREARLSAPTPVSPEGIIRRGMNPCLH